MNDRYLAELSAAYSVYKRLLELENTEPESVRRTTQLLMLEKSHKKLSQYPIGYRDSRHTEIDQFFRMPATLEALGNSRVCIKRLISTRDHKGIQHAMQQIKSFRKKVGHGKRLGAGYRSKHSKVSGGAIESQRRKH